jgi:hypothetical protein
VNGGGASDTGTMAGVVLDVVRLDAELAELSGTGPAQIPRGNADALIELRLVPCL